MPLQNKGLILLTVLAVAALSIIACKTPGDSDYDTRADTEQIALLRGRKILLLPIQYSTKNLRLAPVVYKDTASGVEEPDAASIKQILGYQAAAIKRHFQPMFSVENADENDSRLKPPIEITDSERIKSLLSNLGAVGGLFVSTSCGFSTDSDKTVVQFFFFATKVSLVNSEGKVIWTFYGKASAVPGPAETLNPAEISRGVLGVGPSSGRLLKAQAAIIEHYSAYLGWMLQVDATGPLSKNYFTDYPEEKRNLNRRVVIYGATEAAHVPFVADAAPRQDYSWREFVRNIRATSKRDALIGFVIGALITAGLIWFLRSEEDPGEDKPVVIPALLAIVFGLGTLAALIRLVFIWP